MAYVNKKTCEHAPLWLAIATRGKLPFGYFRLQRLTGEDDHRSSDVIAKISSLELV